jgi:tRNA-splicing ligase RtcB
MRVPAIILANENLLREVDDKVYEQAVNVTMLPGIVQVSYAMPDAHWGYGFPIGGVAAFDPEEGVVCAGDVGFYISCGVRTMLTGLKIADVQPAQKSLADSLYRQIPAGVGSTSAITLDDAEMDAMLTGGARWAIGRGWGDPHDLERIEEVGQMAGAIPQYISERARERQRHEMGTLGSGNQYLEVQVVVEIFDAAARAPRIGLRANRVRYRSALPGRDARSHQLRPRQSRDPRSLRPPRFRAFLSWQGLKPAVRHFPQHLQGRDPFVKGKRRTLFVHRKGATRAFGPGHESLPAAFRAVGQPVLIGGSMGTSSYILAGAATAEQKAFSSACHGAGRAMSRHAALKQWSGRAIPDALAAQGIPIRSPSTRGIAEEAPGAYKDVDAVVLAAQRAAR